MIRLTPVSYIVLGLLDRAGGAATPYQLKAVAATSVGNFWTVQHAQLYSEPQRLAEAGLLVEEREEGGRRRREYRLTDAGREALAAWLATPAEGPAELRDPALLQLFLGAEPGPLAEVQHARHTARLAEFEALHASAGQWLSEGQRLALEAGIGHGREWVRFWGALRS